MKNATTSVSTAGLLLAVFALAVPLVSPAGAATEDLRRHVERLSSEELGGRMTGTEGARKAAAYLEAELENLEAEPLPGAEGFELPFEFTAGTDDAGSSLSLRRAEGGPEESWAGTDLVRALSFSDNGSVTAPVVFAGYGLVVPESQDYPYDSFATLDVEDKIVLILRYFPEDVDQESRAILSRFAGLRYKALQARERGAKAVVVVTGPRSPNAGETIPLKFDTAISGSGIVAASISGEVAEKIFELVEDKTLGEAQLALDDGNPHVAGFEIPGLELTLDVKVEREKKTAYNVVGVLPGSAADSVEKPYVVFGAHYDHLGRGQGGNSLAKKEEAGQIHYGADDNASGVAAVLEAAEAVKAAGYKRDVVLAFWTGEEIGLLGATDFLKNPALDPERIAAYVNLDQVGRMKENKLSVQAVGSSSAWPGLLERTNVPIGFDVQTSEDPYVPTDSTAFNQKSVPTLFFFTGGHEDYHRPTDTAEKLNYEDLDRVASFSALMVRKIADLEEPPDFVKVEPRRQEGGGRDSVRAYTGTIPDYVTEVEGLRLSGVVGGGPAEEAGLQEGDVIVEFGGTAITNIYDYTYALDAVKIDVPLQVVFLRDGERHEVTITPRARK